jgi:flagellar P-ring protein FlgI
MITPRLAIPRSLLALLALMACGVLLATTAFAQPATTNTPTQPNAATPAPARDNPTTSIQELVRIEGYAKTPLRGIGIVVGLRGTGDAGSEPLLARPLARWYENNGNPLADIRELVKSKSAAIVTISAEVPEGGARSGDTFDAYVQISHSATSLRGGTLILSPLFEPRAVPADRLHEAVYAFASGPIVIEEADIPTSGRIRLGMQLAKDIRPRPVGNTFNLIIKPYLRSFATARTLASEINGITTDLENADLTTDIASAVDDTTIRVVIPAHERASPANFIASILTKRFSPSLIELPAMVVVNERTGSIVVTGDVEISAVTVGNERLIVTTTTPPPQPSAQDPLVRRDNWTDFGSTATTGERARITDLLEAFKQLNVPVREQIAILGQIDRAGRLHGRLVRE